MSDERGTTAVEYALLIGLIALVSVTAWTAIGDALKAVFQQLVKAL
ncbi:MAG: Flp family type IVb pilin [Rhodospirillaceae bacterium]|nr:Flp family type IVb pilin [Rhodospirillaceae bacterium]